MSDITPITPNHTAVRQVCVVWSHLNGTHLSHRTKFQRFTRWQYGRRATKILISRLEIRFGFNRWRVLLEKPKTESYRHIIERKAA